MIRLFKTFVTVLSAAAVAAQPALAALRPCCCVSPAEVGRTEETIARSIAVVPQAEVARPCCALKHERPIGSPVAKPADSCCDRTSPLGGSVAAGGCCCLEAPPAVPPSRDAAKQKAEHAPSVPVLALVDSFGATPAALRSAQDSEPPPLSGPPLLALYCIWRK